jgi:hypothetical protein
MRKLLLTLAMICFATQAYAVGISVDPFISPDDVTIPHLEQFRTRVVDAINSFPGTNIQAGTIPSTAMDANGNIVTRWAEAFNNFVYTGLLPTTTVATLTSTTSAGTAYINGYRVVKDATGHLYTATKWTFVDLSQNGTYTYSETTIGAAEPAVATLSIRLCRVTTDGTAITAVRDDRVLSISLGITENFLLKGFDINYSSTTLISLDPGTLNNGTTSVSKTAYTQLDIANAAHYTTGASQRGTSKWLYVYCDNTGTFALDATAPNRHDIVGTTIGTLYYYYDSTKYWRCVGAIRLNATGLGEIVKFIQFGDMVNYDVPVSVNTAASDTAWSAAVSCSAAIPAISRQGIFVYNTVSSDWSTTLTGAIRANGSTYAVPDSNQGDVLGDRFCGANVWSYTDASQQIQHYEDGITSVVVSAYISVKSYKLNIK